MDPIYGGKTGQNKTPMPRFPPDAEGAIVMTRPTAEHEASFNKKLVYYSFVFNKDKRTNR